VSRYQLPGVTFLLLGAAELLRGVRLDRRLLAPAIVVAAAASASGILFLDQSYRSYRGTSELERADLAALEISRDRVDPGLVLTEDIAGTGYVQVEAGDYLSARDTFGSPAYSLTELSGASEPAQIQADRVLGKALPVSLAPTIAPREAVCRRVRASEPGVVLPLSRGGASLRLGSTGRVSVSLGRFSESFPVVLGSLPRDSWERLRIPTDRSSKPWRAALSGRGTVTICQPPPGHPRGGQT
jgi:hypothetical protein